MSNEDDKLTEALAQAQERASRVRGMRLRWPEVSRLLTPAPHPIRTNLPDDVEIVGINAGHVIDGAILYVRSDTFESVPPGYEAPVDLIAEFADPGCPEDVHRAAEAVRGAYPGANIETYAPEIHELLQLIEERIPRCPRHQGHDGALRTIKEA